MSDPTQPLEPFLKSVLASLDLQYQSPSSNFPNVEAYATQFAKQLKQTSAVIVNGKPVIPTQNDSRLEFQKKWLQAPVSSHQLNSYDAHLIPGTTSFIVSVNGKVRFDETGRNRLDESADLINPTARGRPVWGSWYGFNMNLVIDQSLITNHEAQLIDSMNYRITFKPSDSAISLA